MGVYPAEVPQGGPCFPHFAVESSPYHLVQEVASSLSLPEQEALVLLESSQRRNAVAQGIFLGTRALPV